MTEDYAALDQGEEDFCHACWGEGMGRDRRGKEYRAAHFAVASDRITAALSAQGVPCVRGCP